MRVLYLVRHGRTVASERGLLNGWNDSRLTLVGRAESLELRETLASRAFDSVWTSDLPRALETARLAGRPDAIPDVRLRELDFGLWDGLAPSALPHAAAERFGRFDDFEARGGESVRHLRDRVGHFLDRLPAGRHAVFTHGGVLRAVQALADQPATSIAPSGYVEVVYPSRCGAP